MRKLTVFLGYVLLGIGLILIGFVLSHIIRFTYFLHTPLLTPTTMTTNNDETVLIELLPGMSMSQVAQQLQQRGYLTHPNYFVLYACFTNRTHDLQAGEYALSYQATPTMVLDQLTQGDVLQHLLTLVEGWTITELLNAVRANPNLTHTDSTEQLLKTISTEFSVSHSSLEGLFYPDTYAFPKGTTAYEFLQRAYQRMQQQLADAWQTRDTNLPYPTPYYALILASLIEKEASIADERRLIASVMLNRLRDRMPLQIDAAVLYGINRQLVQPKVKLTRADLRQKTAYNTYLHRGLPPTPIALVSADALDAALHPAQTDYYYYVAKGDGSHHFSKTLKAHRQAVVTYQLNSTQAQGPSS